jgi:IS30 family transposase
MKHITSEERHTIDILLRQNQSPTRIARELGREPSSITREIQRNCDKRSGEYRHELAHRKALRRKVEKGTRNDYTEEIKLYVKKQLAEQYSPEQIAGTAKRQGIKCVSHETIYQHIWENKKQGGRLYENLRNRCKRYRNRGSEKDKRGQLRNRTDIDQRPEIVKKRERLGDLEIDLIIGKGHSGALLTINDRVSGLLIMEQLQGKGAAELTARVIARLLPFKEQLHTITSDNGREFAGHEQIARELEIDFYFAKPYHSWERGSNENLNGLIRQYVPKDTNINDLKTERIVWIETQLNNRPRKRHGYFSPNEIHQQLTNDPKVALAS